MAVVEYERDGHIVVITMNRPERLNAMNRELVEGLADAWARFDGDTDARVGILTGAGRGFCSGADLKAHLDPGAQRLTGGYPERDPFWTTNTLDKPTIAAVNGLCYGGGWFMVGKADLRVAVESARFECSEIHRNILGDYGFQLLHSMGSGVAAEIALGGTLSAQRLYEVGFLNRVVPDGEALRAAISMAEQLLAVPPLALSYTLRLMHKIRNRAVTRPVPSLDLPQEILDLRNAAVPALRDSDDSKEARQAFIEKRVGVYHG